MAGLTPEIEGLLEFSPVEDVMLAVLRDAITTIPVQSLIEADQQAPFILVRREPSFGQWDGDARFVDAAYVVVETFCKDPDGDEDAARLAEAVRVVLIRAAARQKVYPGLGNIAKVEMTSAPRRAPDWATSTGPVQYADLPTGLWRYETKYRVEIRKPRRA